MSLVLYTCVIIKVMKKGLFYFLFRLTAASENEANKLKE